MAIVTVTFSFDDKDDPQLKRWLDGLPKRGKSGAIRAALRSYLGLGGVTLGDVYQAVKELDRKLQSGAIVAHSTESANDALPEEPPDVAAALDSLGL